MVSTSIRVQNKSAHHTRQRFGCLYAYISESVATSAAPYSQSKPRRTSRFLPAYINVQTLTMICQGVKRPETDMTLGGNKGAALDLQDARLMRSIPKNLGPSGLLVRSFHSQKHMIQRTWAARGQCKPFKKKPPCLT